MRTRRPRLTPLFRLRLPRTARLRLTILSGTLFLLAGAALLAFTYLLFETGSHGSDSAGGPSPPGAGHPLSALGQHTGHVSAAAARQAAAAAQSAVDKHDLLIDSGIALLVLAVLAVVLGWFFAGRMLAPVKTITATARRISASNLGQRLALHDADEEFKQLGDTLDDLLARLQAAFDAQQHFVANASHELRTPLTTERALLQVALDDPHTTNQEWRATANELLAANDEQEQLIEALLALASSEAGLDQHEPLDLSVLTDTVLLDRRAGAKDKGIEITTAIETAPTAGSPALIERLIANLIDNAIRYNNPGGHIHIQTTTAADGHAKLLVSNSGPEIPATDVARLFQPFQRLKTTRTNGHAGYGLGLSIVEAIATAHHAQITAKPRHDGGLHIQVSFSAANAPWDAHQTPSSHPTGHKPADHRSSNDATTGPRSAG